MPTFPEQSGSASERRPRSVLPVSLLLAAVAFGLTLASAGVVDAVRSTIRDGLRPGQHGLRALVNSVKSTMRDWLDAEPEKETDKSVNVASAVDRAAELRRAKIRLALLEEELQRAKRLGVSPYRDQNAKSPMKIELLQAHVMGEETAALWRGGLLLDRGAGDGLAESDLVLKDDGRLIAAGKRQKLQPGYPVFAGRCVIGRVRTVGKWTSTVEPITAVDFRGHAQIIRKTSEGFVFGASGVIQGTGEDDCRLTLIPPSEPVAVGDEVYTLSDGGVFPVPMYYGRVTKANLPGGATHWEIHVSPATHNARPRTVQVLRKRLKVME